MIDFFGELGIDAVDDVNHKARVHWFVHCPEKAFGDGLFNYGRDTDCRFECPGRICRTCAVAPNAEAVFTDEGGNVEVVDGIGVAVDVQKSGSCVGI